MAAVIFGYVGYQGQGKTMWLTRDVLRALDIGLPVVSNYPVVDPVSGLASEVVDLTSGLKPVYEFGRDHPEGSMAAITEIGQLMPARMWQATTTFRVINDLSQTRKARMHLGWDAQFLDMVDKLIRANTEICYECRVPLRHPWKRDQGAVLDLRTGRRPKRPLLLVADGFRPKHMDLAEDHRKERRLDRRVSLFSERVASAYDTYRIEAVRVADAAAVGDAGAVSAAGDHAGEVA